MGLWRAPAQAWPRGLPAGCRRRPMMDTCRGGMMMAMPAGGAAGGEAGAAAAEEKTEFDLVLDSFPADKKIAVLKVVRELTGLGLKEAKEKVESAPCPIKEGAPKAECEEAVKKLEELGAKAVLK